MAGGPTPPESPARNGNKMSGAVSSSPRVRLTMKRFKSMEAGACSNPEDVQPATKKAAQKLTNFRGYLHKSSVAGCFVDLLEMTNEGVMTEAGLYPSSRYKQSRNMRQSGLGTSSHSRPLTGLHGLNKHDKSQTPLLGPSNNQAEDQDTNQQQQRGHHGRRPSTALETPTAPLAAQPTRDAPLSARVGLSAGNSFAGTGARILTASSPSCHNNNKSGDIAGSRATTLDIQRTQWVEGDSKQGVGGWLEEGAGGQPQQQQGQQQQRQGAVSATGPETNDDVEEGEKEGRNGGGDDESGGDHAGGRCNTSSTTSTSTADSPKPFSDSPKPFSRKAAWGKAMRELSSTVTKVAHMKTAADRAMVKSSHERRVRAASVRAGLIEGELLRAQAALNKNENRKRRATEAAALVASQRGLFEVITLVVATKRLWAGSLKLLQDREHLAQLGIAATVVQRAYKAYTNRRMFKVLLAIRRVHLRLYIGMNIRRKQMAVTKMQWFLATGSGGAKARPRKVIRAFMYQVRRCQRAAREWLACRAATIEAICRLWERIESEIRRGLGDELDRAKRVWVKHALRTGEDSHIHGQWRELKAKTRSLVARIDRLEAQMERQQTRDKKARVQAARSMLKRRSGVTRGHRKATQLDSAENLRTSTVSSSKRLAIIRSSLNAKFSLHQQGGRRVERTGNRVIGEMDARMVIRGEFPDAPPDDSSEGAAAATSSAALTVARSTKRSRALIYTGDLGRSWQQIVEDAVMQDFRRNAFARKDSMPYLQYSVVLSLDMMAATGNTDGPSASAMAAAAAAAAAAAVPTGDATTANGSGRDVLGRASIGSTASSGLEQRRRRGREGSAGGGGSGAARVVLEPII